ncbi:MAG: hypothetical protein ACOX6Q_02395 [Candidatus Dojkabacteria bacterium]|jgi:hypothetical protein
MQNKTSKIKDIGAKILEPVIIVALVLVFVIPILSVINISPITRQLKKLDVLGVTTQSSYVIDLVEGKHRVFTSEKLRELENKDTFEYTTNIGKRSGDRYSKPILKIRNKGAESKTFIFDGSTAVNTKSNILLNIENKSYKLQGDNGITHTQEIVVKPNSEITIFLVVESLNSIQFSEEFKMNISTK